ncbi:TadE/TadG family type IV pilus assembly protein [Rhizobium mongolense]|uniref:TadE/TadG family type IV pilus assembly protein n=1 Tax=Rhizobium mongolense TaxID=57676 RepID=UPI003557C572
MKKLARRFSADRSGNFGIMTALLAVPVLGAAGMAVDFAHALSLRTQLYAAADAAAVGSVSEKSDAVTAAMAMKGDGSISLGKADAQKLFFAQMSGELSEIPVDLDIDVAKTTNKLNSTVTFSATVPTAFMQILGKNRIAISGTATAEYQTASFMDFYILLDNTPSMGVGATPEDVALLRNATKNGNKEGKDKDCAFACHIVSESGVEDKESYFYLARSIGATIRIDVVAKATEALMTTARKSQVAPAQYQMAAYTFGKKSSDANLYTVSELTDDLTAVGEATKNITLMSIPSHNTPNNQTSYDNVLTSIEKKIPTGGSGMTKTDREKILFFVADGVGDSIKPTTCTKRLNGGKRCMEPIDTSYCQKLKDKNVKIAILYTTYLPLPENSFYRDWIAPFQSEIPQKMKECASPGLYFEVTPTEGISDAMNALFLKVIHRPRLTG